MNAARGQLPPHRERIASISPQWTPDGSLVALGHMGDIYTVAPDDAASLRLVHGGGGELDVRHSPKISPDGSRMAYMKYEHSNWAFFTRHNWEAATSMMDGVDERNIDGETPADRDSDRLWYERDHAWSPDSSRLALNWGGVVYLIDADGSNMRLVLKDYNRVRGDVGNNSLRWSPDGSRLSFVINISKEPRLAAIHPESVIYAIGADGSNLTRIYQGEHISSPTWSPDGSRIAFVESTRTDGGSALFSTRTASPDGGVPTTLHETVDVFDRYIEMKEASWSSDGTKLLVSVANSARVVNADGSGSRTLVNLRPAHPPRNLSASWSPDGSKIAVYNGGGYEGALFTMSPDGSDKRVLAEYGNPLRPAQNQAWDPAYDAPTPTPAPGGAPNQASVAP